MQNEAHQALQQLYEQHHEFKMRNYPEWATYEGDHRFNNQLTDLSDEAHQRRYDELEQMLQALKSIDTTDLPEEERLNEELFEMLLQEEKNERAFNFHYMPINQLLGIHIQFPEIIEFQPLNNVQEFSDYFTRLHGFKQQIQDTVDNMRRGMEKGIVEVDFLMTQTLPQIEKIWKSPPENSPFYLPLRREHLPLSPAEKEKLGQDLKTIIQKEIQPTYQRLFEFIRDEYLPVCRKDAGLWSLPDGQVRYQLLLEKYTKPGLNADDIHQVGLKEVNRIYTEMEKIKHQIGFDGSMREFNHFLRVDPRFYYTDKVQQRADFQQLLEQAQALLPQFFGIIPKASCHLKEMEDYRAESAPQAYYYPPPRDGSRPGYFYYNSHDLPSRPKFTMTALTLHEAVPGHHLQIAIANEIEDIPYFRKLLEATAFVEGWGLYAESLGYEMGMYDDPYQHYGALSFEMWRACRLVVDTGLHHKRWTREEAVDFMRKYTSNSELDIRSEVDRYIGLPGQALSYKIGEIKIQELRKKAETILGKHFNVKDFHNAVIRHGSLTLEILEKHVNEWLDICQSV